MKIITNNHWRQFEYRNEVPEEVLKDQFDYQDPKEVFDGYFCYRGIWYHLDQFMRIEHHPDSEFSSWDGYHGDSYFSGVIIKLSDDGEEYKVGTYLS